MQDPKQELIINYLLSSPDTFAICSGILEPSFFNPGYDKAIEFIQNYYKQYGKTPDCDQVAAETGKLFVKKHVAPDQIEYCIKEVEEHCKREALTAAVVKCAKSIAKEESLDISKTINDALKVSIHRDLGLDYFDDPMARLLKLRENNPMCSTGWRDVDQILGGGIHRGQLQLFAAPPGGGKSMALANLGVNFCTKGKNVLYISLELDPLLISNRLDSMFTGISQGELRSRYKEVAIDLNKQAPKMGKFKVIQMPSGSRAMDIRAYMEEIFLREGWRPELLLVDYLDLMGSNEKVDASNMFVKDKFTSEQLRDILVSYNIYGASASQLNRQAIGADELNQAHTAGGMSKVNTTDNYIAIIMSDSMRANGEMIYHFLKTRSSDGVGKRLPMRWNGNSLRITDATDGSGSPDLMSNFTNKEPCNTGSDDLAADQLAGSGLGKFLKF